MGYKPYLAATLSPAELARTMGERVRACRLAQRMRQEDLAARTGVSLRTLARLEAGVDVALSVLIKVAYALGVERDLAALFPAPEARSFDEILRARAHPRAQRVRRKD